MIVVYGTARFNWMDADYEARLTSEGWRVEPADATVLDTLDAFCNPTDFEPAQGNPMACAVLACARLFRGTHTLARLPGPPEGTLF